MAVDAGCQPPPELRIDPDAGMALAEDAGACGTASSLALACGLGDADGAADRRAGARVVACAADPSDWLAPPPFGNCPLRPGFIGLPPDPESMTPGACQVVRDAFGRILEVGVPFDDPEEPCRAAWDFAYDQANRVVTLATNWEEATRTETWTYAPDGTALTYDLDWPYPYDQYESDGDDEGSGATPIVRSRGRSVDGEVSALSCTLSADGNSLWIATETGIDYESNFDGQHTDDAWTRNEAGRIVRAVHTYGQEGGLGNCFYTNDGGETRYAYDAAGRLVEVVISDAAMALIDAVAVVRRDALGTEVAVDVYRPDGCGDDAQSMSTCPDATNFRCRWCVLDCCESTLASR